MKRDDEREFMIAEALRKADVLVTQVIRGDSASAWREAYELASTLNDLKRKYGILR